MGHLIVGNISGNAVDVIVGEVGCLAANGGRAIACDGSWQRGSIDSTVVEVTLQALQRHVQNVNKNAAFSGQLVLPCYVSCMILSLRHCIR